MKKTAIICLVVAFATLGTTGTVKALQILGADVAKVGELETGTLTVGEQGVGGVTFFNGTIVNETTTGGLDNPVTFGDNVRIDGRMYRGASAGPSDGEPFIINDDIEITGELRINGQKLLASADYSSRFDNVDNGLHTINSNQTILQQDINTLNENIITLNKNLETHDTNLWNLGNTISTNAYISCLWLASNPDNCDDTTWVKAAADFKSTTIEKLELMIWELKTRE